MRAGTVTILHSWISQEYMTDTDTVGILYHTFFGPDIRELSCIRLAYVHFFINVGPQMAQAVLNAQTDRRSNFNVWLIRLRSVWSILWNAVWNFPFFLYVRAPSGFGYQWAFPLFVLDTPRCSGYVWHHDRT
jgi:hypothetical protein